jgi:hypothetical protein
VDLAAIGVHVSNHSLEEEVDLAWLETDVGVPKLVDRRLHGRREAIDGALAHAVDAFVRVHPDEQPVLPGVAHQIGRDAGDLH